MEADQHLAQPERPARQNVQQPEQDHFFSSQERSKKDLKTLTEKPVTPEKEEIKINRRSRSAKLRAALYTKNF